MEAPVETDPASERRRWRRVAILGAVLLTGPILGLVGTVVGMLMSFRRIETMKAPTPDDLAVGVTIGLVATLVGFVLGGIGAVLLTVALVRLGRLRPVPGGGPGTAPWR